MGSPYTREKIENWVSDFCVSDAMREFSPGVKEVAGGLLVTFLGGACEVRGVEPDEVEEGDVRQSLVGAVARLAVPEEVRGEIPALCGEFLSYLEDEGRLGGGRMLGAFTRALGP